VVNGQMAPLLNNIASLNAKEVQRTDKLAKDKAAARKAEKLAEAAEKRVQTAEAQLGSRSGTLNSKFARFSNFAPFPYEAERKRVLSWYSK